MNINSPSTTLLGKFLTILLGYIAILVWMIGISHFITWLVPPPPPSPWDKLLAPEEPPFRLMFFITVIWAPFWEEMFHRHAFGLIVKRIGNQFLLPVMIISSFLFASGHSDNIQFNVMRQGIMGMILFYVYVKNGYSIWSSMILHSAWNLTCMFAPDWIW